jgi:outer membrane protein OmpA-like peptidoglycan-associated protein
VLGLLVAACAAPPAPVPVQPPPVRSYVVLLESPDGHVGSVHVQKGQTTTVLEHSLQAVELDAESSRSFQLPQQKLESDFAGALAARPPLPETFRLYFATGVAHLTPESERLVRDLLAAVRSRAAPDVSIIGHTDTQGDEEANRRLGLQRARWVAQMLARHGLSAVEVTVASHGERDPLVPTPDGTDEPRNRRVEVIVR